MNNTFSRHPGSRSAHFGGRPKFGGPRSSGGNSRSPMKKQGRGQYIHPSKFVNKAVEAVSEVPYAPTHQFADFKVSNMLHDNIESAGYKSPSAIQDQAIPLALEGKDVIGLANTGTGKTAAFIIPMIERIQYSKATGPTALIITPTRELASQIEDEFRKFSKNMRLYSTVCVGGMNIGRQISQLKRRPHVVIGTPGRLKDLINQRVLKLSDIEVLVLDEADRMLDMGFINDIKAILREVPEQRQTLCFSATITPGIQDAVISMMKNPETVSVRTSETSEHVEQDIIKANSKEHKIELLSEMLANEEFEKVLVFGETKYGVQRLADTLTKNGHASEAIHGNKSQPQRQRALDKFKKNDVKVLVATDVAARGLDIPNVSHVINFDQPNTYDDYVHRIGRTGRGGARGVAYTFVDHR